MTKVKITVLKRQDPHKIFDELPVKEQDWMEPCPVYVDGQEFVIDKIEMPENFCTTAWISIYPNIRMIYNGGNLSFFEEKGTAITCCFDGLRPVIFKVERIED